MQLIKEYIRENKKVLLIIVVIGITLGIVSIYINNQKDKKVYMSDDYVYTKESYAYDEYLVSELPYINIKGNEVQEINSDLLNKYYEIIELKEKMMKYDYYTNNNILSLIVKIYYIESPDSSPSISIYNIDIDSGELMTNSEILNMFEISSDDASEVIHSQIKEYYNYEVQNGYVDNGCNFDCYLSKTNSLPIDDYELYVKDHILYAYKKLSVDRDFYYDTSSGFGLFNFEIKKK